MRIPQPTLELQKFTINETPADNVFVHIVGRASGFIGWLLTVMGLSAPTSFKLTNKEISLTSSSLMGETHQVVPLPCVASTHCAYSKPISYLIAAAVFLILGIFSSLNPFGGKESLMVFLLISVILFMLYFFSKKFTISLETTGGTVLGLSFKRSIIENISVDMEQALKVISIINQKVIEHQIK